MADFDINTLRQLGFGSNIPPRSLPNVGEDASTYGQPITDSVFGLNFMQTPLPVPMNKDHYGFTFFTRPMLNLQRANIKNVRAMSDLLTVTELSFQRVVRCYLDPRLQLYQNVSAPDGSNMGVDCRLVDPYSPFIALLSNHLVACSGIPDKFAPVYRSPEGQYREVHSMIDGTSRHLGAYNISATFRNSRGDPITKLFDTWVDYSALVFENLLAPYMDVMLAGMADYNTRIYRVILEPSKRYVAGIAMCGAAFPLGVPKGQQYDYNSDKPYNDANNQMTIQFEANGAVWDDPICIWAFNTVVGAFNPSMRTAATRAQNMKLVPHDLASFFNCRAYPRIDPATRRMEWWVTNTYFAAIFEEARKTVDYLLDISTGTERKDLMSDLARPETNLITI